MSDQLYCPECADKWSGAYNTDHRCVTCGSPLKAEEVNDELERVRGERDALAAHVERLLEAMAQVADYWNGGEGLAAEDAAQHAQDVACDMLESIPADDSLARLKAEAQVEAFEGVLAYCKAVPQSAATADRVLRILRERTEAQKTVIRRQAEGGDS